MAKKHRETANSNWERQLREDLSRWLVNAMHGRIRANALAAASGVSEATLSRIRSQQQTPDGATLDAIAEALGVRLPRLCLHEVVEVHDLEGHVEAGERAQDNAVEEGREPGG